MSANDWSVIEDAATDIVPGDENSNTTCFNNLRDFWTILYLTLSRNAYLYNGKNADWPSWRIWQQVDLLYNK